MIRVHNVDTYQVSSIKIRIETTPECLLINQDKGTHHLSINDCSRCKETKVLALFFIDVQWP